MARKCKCKACGNELTTDTGYKAVDGKYYCNEQEYDERVLNLDYKKKTFLLLEECMGYDNKQILPPIFRKKIGEYALSYPYEIIYFTVINNKDTILYWVSRDDKFKNDFGKACYIASIIGNNINDTYIKVKRDNKVKKNAHTNMIDIELMDDIEQTICHKKNTNDISNFLD